MPPFRYQEVPNELIDNENDQSSEASATTAAFDCVKKGDIVGLEAIFKAEGRSIFNERDEWGYTLAHWVALNGNARLLQFLIDKKAPVNLSCIGTQGPKPIHWACRKGHLNIISILLQQAGVDINVCDLKGLTPLMTACIYGRLNACVFLLGMGAKHHLADSNNDTAAHWAAYKGYVDIIRMLINAGADMGIVDKFGSTPLHLACLYGHLDCVKVLCTLLNLNLEAQDKNGRTSLTLAKKHHHKEVVEFLQVEIKKRNRFKGFQPIADAWNAVCEGFGKGNKKGPAWLFIGSMFLWCYPMYFLRCIPLTWDRMRIAHYCFFYWNALMWVCWLGSVVSNPGFLVKNTDAYTQIILSIPYSEKNKNTYAPFAQLCHTCRCVRPLRSKHCRICNRCVSFFDHHCSFINNCIGIGNRMRFFMFLLCLSVNSTFCLYFVVYCIVHTGYDNLLLLSLIQSMVMACYSWLQTSISFMYACMNITTNEMLNYKRYPYLRDKKGKYYNWFSRGWFLNLVEFFTGSFRQDIINNAA